MCDIREMINKYNSSMNWEDVVNRAKEKNIDCMVYHALYYSSALLGFKTPDNVLEKLRPSFIRRKLHESLWRRDVILWKREGETTRFRVPFEMAVFLFGGKFNASPRMLIKTLYYFFRALIDKTLRMFRD